MKLPNAPLAEVVFELRWALEGPSDVPVQLRQDPAYSLMSYEFTDRAKRAGFVFRREMSTSPTGPLGHSVHYRFTQDDQSPFPLLQIGPGLFAYNESTNYEWTAFKKSLREALRILLASYPKTKLLRMKPVHMELRYIDTFDVDLLGHNDIARFVNENTNMKIEQNEFLRSKHFSEETEGRIHLIKRLKDAPDTIFSFDAGAGEANNRPGIVSFTKVIKQAADLELGETPGPIMSNITKWADRAHGLTHEFFWDFIGADLMKKFGK